MRLSEMKHLETVTPKLRSSIKVRDFGNRKMASVHIPILVSPIVQALSIPFQEEKSQRFFLDCTFGGGGHSRAFLEHLEKVHPGHPHKIIGIDRDLSAIKRGELDCGRWIEEGKLELHHRSFSDILPLVEDRPLFAVLADFGFSSDQLESHERGFSFKRSGPLDMRMDLSSPLSCYELLSEISEEELEAALREDGEEPFSKRIAQSIVLARDQGLLPKTTVELSQLIIQALPFGMRHQKIHGATKTFQALRMRVNEELPQIEFLLNQILPRIEVGGRVALMSFHSLEDRRVKNYLKNSEEFLSLPKKAIQADYQEVQKNPRARSAKLRIAEKSFPNLRLKNKYLKLT